MRRMLFVLLTLLTLPALAYGQTETIEYYATDALGSIRVVYDANGNVLGRQDFTPFGTPVFNATAMPKEGFVGNEQDDESTLAYFHARMLQARTGRFTSVDAMFDGIFDPQRWNRYTYGRNSPLRYLDRNGQAVCDATKGAYWCPTNPNPNSAYTAENAGGPPTPPSVDRFFDPSQYGYHGGEVTAAEAMWGAALDSAFIANAISSFAPKRPTSSQNAQPRPMCE